MGVRRDGRSHAGGAAGGGAPARRAVFRIALAPGAAPTTGESRRGLIRDFVVGQIKAIIIKFAARLAVGAAMTWLEAMSVDLRTSNPQTPPSGSRSST